MRGARISIARRSGRARRGVFARMPTWTSPGRLSPWPRFSLSRMPTEAIGQVASWAERRARLACKAMYIVYGWMGGSQEEQRFQLFRNKKKGGASHALQTPLSAAPAVGTQADGADGGARTRDGKGEVWEWPFFVAVGSFYCGASCGFVVVVVVVLGR